jgi:hypothetical protein
VQRTESSLRECRCLCDSGFELRKQRLGLIDAQLDFSICHNGMVRYRHAVERLVGNVELGGLKLGCPLGCPLGCVSLCGGASDHVRVLVSLFHVAFWFSIGALACVIAGFALPSERHPSDLAINGLLAFIVSLLVYAVAVGALADKFGRSGAGFAVKSVLFGPVGAVMSYVAMRQILNSGAPAQGPLVPKYTADQKAGHWKLFVIFIVVLVVANVAARLFRAA